jgi:UDP-glucose 4-epimerase
MKWSGKRVLITGALGFIGTHLVQNFLMKNAVITMIDNLSAGLPHRELGDVTLIKGNVEDKWTFAGIKDIDFIYHLGAPSSVILFDNNPAKCITETIIGCYNVLELGARIRPTKTIMMSSGSVYGNTKNPMPEDSVPKPGNLYAISKLLCERLAGIMDRRDVQFVRVFAGFGPGEDHKGTYASPITLFLSHILNGIPPVIFGDGSQTRDFVYIDDVVDALIALADADPISVVNIGSGQTTSFNEVISFINRRLGRKVNPKYIEKPNSYLETTLADITLAKKLFGFSPMSVQDGIDKYCSFLGK